MAFQASVSVATNSTYSTIFSGTDIAHTNVFPRTDSKVVPESRARLILHIELEEPIEKSQLLKYSPDHKSEAVVNK